MFKYLVLIMVLGQLTQAQKSFYAGSQAWYPKVLAKYRTTTTTTTESIDNRVGENTIGLDTTTQTQVGPEEESEYDRFIHRVSNWPADKQPFWYKNREAISAMINQGVDGGNGQQGSSNSLGGNIRSPFAGRG
ncbi:UNVERIFIED_CONTAM: hypothetical protein PYX00_000260 [Menopon gallinae]|uniref:Uncharacterized protein n=1 Tax=Menopon gallinae TaxID=328185 RepID=A0AAW2I9G2_9NEOP